MADIPYIDPTSALYALYHALLDNAKARTSASMPDLSGCTTQEQVDAKLEPYREEQMQLNSYGTAVAVINAIQLVDRFGATVGYYNEDKFYSKCTYDASTQSYAYDANDLIQGENGGLYMDARTALVYGYLNGHYTAGGSGGGSGSGSSTVDGYFTDGILQLEHGGTGLSAIRQYAMLYSDGSQLKEIITSTLGRTLLAAQADVIVNGLYAERAGSVDLDATGTAEIPVYIDTDGEFVPIDALNAKVILDTAHSVVARHSSTEYNLLGTEKTTDATPKVNAVIGEKSASGNLIDNIAHYAKAHRFNTYSNGAYQGIVDIDSYGLASQGGVSAQGIVDLSVSGGSLGGAFLRITPVDASGTQGEEIDYDGTDEKSLTVVTAHQDISGKVDKVTGKGLSTNDYSDTEQNKVTASYGMRHSHDNKSILDNIEYALTSDMSELFPSFS